ncbi:hypothetical protein PLICRDRAFT_492381 [Plicaturopsis crispa FD-325 SS-3]|nr:hypothetical protein PLICRDRAFT_492381 [Plicaturopsis crispa FD-325 SS-3]
MTPPSGEPVEPSASSLQTKKKPSSSKSRDVPKSRVHPASVPDNSDAVDNVQDIADGRTDDEATVKKKKKRSRSKSKPPGDSVSTAPPSADAPSAEEPSEVTSSKPPKKKAKKKVDQPESDAVGDRGNVLKDGVTTDALAPKSQKGSKPKTTALHQVPGKDGEPAPMSLVDDSLDAASIKEPAKKVKRKKSHKLPVVEAEPVDGGGAVADADATTPVAAPEKNAGADAATEPASKAKKPRKVVDQTVADGKKPSHKSSGKNKKPDVADDNGDAMDVDEDANPAGRQAQGSDQRPAQDKGATAGDTVPPAKPTSKKSKPDHTRGKANDARAHTDAIQSAPRAPSESPSVVPSSSPPCPLCLSGSFHLRARCPVITSDTETIRERLAKLKAENSGNHDALISELEELLRKRDATASTTAPPVSNGRGPPKISSSSTKQSRSKAPPSSLVPDSLLGDDSSDDGRFIGKNQTTRTVLPHADDDLEALIRGPALSQQSILVDVPSASVSDDGRNEASAEEAIEEEEYHHSARSQSSSKVSRIAAIPSLDRSSPSGDERSDASDHGANDEDTAQHDEILEDVSFEAIYGDSSQLPPQESSNLNVPDAAEHDEDVAQDGHATTSGLAHEPKSTALDTAGRTRKASTARRPLPEELEIVPETSDLDDEPAENQIQAPPPPAPVHRSERPVSAAHTESNYRPGTPVSSRHSPNTAQAVIMEGPTTSAAGPKVDKPLPSDGPAVPPLQSQGLQSSQPVASEASAANASAPVPAPEEKPKPKRGRPKLSEEEKQRRLVEREAAKAIAAEKRRLDREEKARARAQAKEAKDAEKAAQKIGVVTAGVPPQARPRLHPRRPALHNPWLNGLHWTPTIPRLPRLQGTTRRLMSLLPVPRRCRR